MKIDSHGSHNIGTEEGQMIGHLEVTTMGHMPRHQIAAVRLVQFDCPRCRCFERCF